MKAHDSSLASSERDTAIIDASSTRQNLGHPLVNLIKDLNNLLLSYLPLEDAVRFSMTCFKLWERNQDLLLKKLLEEGPSYRTIEGLYYLGEMFKLDPYFKTHPPVYSRPLPPRSTQKAKPSRPSPVIAVGYLVSCTLYLLPTIVKSDPYSVWKIAILCGFGQEMAEQFQQRGQSIETTFDDYDRGFLEFASLGGQLSDVENFVVSTRKDPKDSAEPFDIARLDPNEDAAVMAALGGHKPVLQYLKKQGYDLTRVRQEDSLTLLTYAEMNGNPSTIQYLEEEGVNPKAGKSLAFFAASSGHWKRYAKHLDETEEKKEALQLTQFALRNNNLPEALRLIAKYDIPKEELLVTVIAAGNPQIFWHFVEAGWLSLSHKFACGETVEHVLAQAGHLKILITVLQDKRATNGVYALDYEGRSILHYAARGGRWDLYCYLLDNFDQTKLPLIDANGVSTAHCAAKEGAVLFLKRLIEIDSPLLSTLTNNESTILHAAAVCAIPNVLFMIIDEIGIDLEALDSDGKTVVHLLADLAPQKPQCWNTLRFIIERYNAEHLLDVPYGETTIRELIIDSNAEDYFPNHFFETDALICK